MAKEALRRRLTLLEILKIQVVIMATINFSVPDGIKDAFNREFSARSKSAVIARLTRQGAGRLAPLIAGAGRPGSSES